MTTHVVVEVKLVTDFGKRHVHVFEELATGRLDAVDVRLAASVSTVSYRFRVNSTFSLQIIVLPAEHAEFRVSFLHVRNRTSHRTV